MFVFSPKLHKLDYLSTKIILDLDVVLKATDLEINDII